MQFGERGLATQSLGIDDVLGFDFMDKPSRYLILDGISLL